MAEAGTLHDAFIDELRDAYDAEKQLTKALAKLAKAATNPKLRDAFETHLEETQRQITRLEQFFGCAVDVEWTVDTRYDRPALALHEAASRAQLLVLGQHGHDGHRFRGSGSTARTLLRTARCPVMVVPTASHHQSEVGTLVPA